MPAANLPLEDKNGLLRRTITVSVRFMAVMVDARRRIDIALNSSRTCTANAKRVGDNQRDIKTYDRPAQKRCQLSDRAPLSYTLAPLRLAGP